MKRRLRSSLLLPAVALLLIGSAGAAVWYFRLSPQPSSPTSDMAEASALAASNGLVHRDKAGLALRLKSGQTLILTDHVTCGDIKCPAELAVQYRYGGWSDGAGGYRVHVTGETSGDMILPYSDDSPVLLDEHAAPNGVGMSLPTPPQPPTAADETLSEWKSDIADGREQTEAPLIAKLNGAVQRQGGQLSLALDNGQHIALSDDLACGDAACPPQLFRVFDFAGASPDGHFWIVKLRWDEADAALLVDRRNGAVTHLLSEPSFSPDWKRAVASISDLEWTAPHRLEIWSLAGAQPVLEFSLSAGAEDDTVYEVAGWNDPTHIRLRRGSWSSDQRTDATLVFESGAWHLQDE